MLGFLRAQAVPNRRSDHCLCWPASVTVGILEMSMFHIAGGMRAAVSALGVVAVSLLNMRMFRSAADLFLVNQLVGGVILFVATMLFSGSGIASANAQKLPADQIEFVEIVDGAKKGIHPNAPASTLDAMLDRRGYRLCDKIRSAAMVDWLGTVWHIGTTPDGNPTIAILIAPEVGVTTFPGTNDNSPAAAAIVAKGSAISADLVGYNTGEKVRFSGSLIFSDSFRCFASLPGADDLFSPAFYVQLRTIYRTTDGPTLAVRAAPGAGRPELSTDERVSLCKKDWAQCEDNRQLVDNYEQYGAAQKACRGAADELTKYGTPDWTGFTKDLFGTYNKGSRYVSTGVAELVETDARFGNRQGEITKMRLSCLYDLRGQKVIHVFGEPK